MQNQSIRKLFYSIAWDTRCHNADVARALLPIINGESTILDAGCGEYGLSAFISAKSVVGVDVVPTDARFDGFTFIHGSIVALPFAERSFSVAASVDVLEHLPEAIGPAAIRQLVKVADRAIVITFPSGEKVRQIDEAFNSELIDSNQPIAEWLAEHLENQYPETDAVVAEIERKSSVLGRKVRTSIHYSEHLTIASYLRWSAARSRYLYCSVTC